MYDPANDCPTDSGFAAAVAAAQSADQVVLAVGETREMSGEATSRTTIDLPGRQQELIDAIKATGTPFAVVLFNGRPLTLGDVAASSPAILEAWFPGVEAGNSVADDVFGKVDPGGKQPVSFPQRLGQVPRPALLRPSVPVRLRPQLHDVLGQGPRPRPDVGVAVGSGAGDRDGDQHR